jgi:hypothetical protein
LIPKNNPENPFTISITNLENSQEILQWAELNFTNLDKLEYDAEIEKIESDISLGRNKDERMQKLEEAKKWAKALNISAGIFSILTIAYPYPYELIMLITLCFPVLVAGLITFYNGLIKLDGDDNKPYASVFIAAYFPGCALCVRALMDWDVMIFLDIVIPVIIASAAVFLLFYFNLSKENRKLKYALLFYFPFIFYGFGAAITINGIFVDDPPKEYNSVIIEKSMNKKGDKFYFYLASFADFNAPDKFDVSEEIFNRYEEGDNYPIKIQVGNLGIPWIVEE